MLRYLGLNTSPEDTAATFAEFDQDGSGAIDLNEFLVLMHKKVGNHYMIETINPKKFLY